MEEIPMTMSSHRRVPTRPQPPLPMPAPRSKASIVTIAMSTIVGLVCFYMGNIVGMHTGMHHGSLSCSHQLNEVIEDRDRLNRELERMKELALRRGIPEHKVGEAKVDANKMRFPTTVEKFLHGNIMIDRDDFARTFDTGVPLDETIKGNQQVYMIYNRPEALPKSRTLGHAAVHAGDIPETMSAMEATENCDFLNIILTDFKQQRTQCTAIMGQYEAFHIQKFMRLPKSGEVDRQHPLVLVNRGSQANGRKSTKPPVKEHTLEYWKTLGPYLNNLPSVLEKLQPVASKVAGASKTIVVMVCNHGQSELLFNFICSARARNLDLSHILLFATDLETKELAENLGLTVWFDEETFGSMPKEAARQYADPRFTKMMMAKVYCVQLVAMLDYDFLFQDVDLIWFKDPLEFFHNKTHPWYGFDVYFQDDGNHALFYSPYSANTGFYYVRRNDRTRYFFNSMLLAGDLILGTHSHQIALIALLNEHASMYGLKVKILSRDDDDFPGGYHYHNRKPWMREFIKKQQDPFIFHMSWTASKVNKRKFFEQMGFWYLDANCVGQTLSQIGGDASTCCLAHPFFQCHYRDKPSIAPCKDSEPIDKGRRSFWP